MCDRQAVTLLPSAMLNVQQIIVAVLSGLVDVVYNHTGKPNFTTLQNSFRFGVGKIYLNDIQT